MYAAYPSCSRVDSSGSLAVACEPLYSHAVEHQIHPERRRRHRCRFVATECLWTVSFPFPNPRWDIRTTKDEISHEG
jgi:hypothetical protein